MNDIAAYIILSLGIIFIALPLLGSILEGPVGNAGYLTCMKYGILFCATLATVSGIILSLMWAMEQLSK